MPEVAAQSSPARPAPRRRPLLRFLVTFGLLMAIFYALTATPWFRLRLFPAYLDLNAAAAASILRLFGEDAQAHQTIIISPRGALAIKRGCDGIEPAALLVAAILAFPARWRSRWPAALCGAAVLLLLNVVRIVSLFYVRAWFPDAFAAVHIDFWQTAFVLIVMFIWILWAWNVTSPRRKAASHAPAS